jgi:hypothetical protein
MVMFDVTGTPVQGVVARSGDGAQDAREHRRPLVARQRGKRRRGGVTRAERTVPGTDGRGGTRAFMAGAAQAPNQGATLMRGPTKPDVDKLALVDALSAPHVFDDDAQVADLVKKFYAKDAETWLGPRHATWIDALACARRAAFAGGRTGTRPTTVI